MKSLTFASRAHHHNYDASTGHGLAQKYAYYMTRYALLPIDATLDELRDAGIVPDAKREVPGLGYIDSESVMVWVGVESVEGTISMNNAIHGSGREWELRGSADAPEWVNHTRLVVVRIT